MSSNKLNWVIVQLKPNMLKKAESNLLRQSFEYYAPQKEYTVRKGNLFKRVKKLLFPGYIFVKININNHELINLGSTFGISKVLKSSIGKVATLPESFIENLKKIGETDLNIFQKKDYKQGRFVKCIDGPFTGLVGRIYNIDEIGRLKVLFNFINKNCVVSLNSEKVIFE